MFETNFLFNDFLVTFWDDVAWISFKLSVQLFDGLGLIVVDALWLFKDLRVHSILGCIESEPGKRLINHF